MIGLVLFILIILLIGLFRWTFLQITQRTLNFPLKELKSIYLNEDLQWNIHSPMILTYYRLGDRGNTGNQLFELATLIALAKRYQARICLSPRVKSLELWRMFDLTGIPLIDLSEFPRRMIHEWTNYEVIDLDSSEEVIYD